jgi:hypothetical protein
MKRRGEFVTGELSTRTLRAEGVGGRSSTDRSKKRYDFRFQKVYQAFIVDMMERTNTVNRQNHSNHPLPRLRDESPKTSSSSSDIEVPLFALATRKTKLTPKPIQVPYVL